MLLDENKLAAGKPYCATGGVSPSPSHALLAYSEDTTGYETYTLRLRDLRTGAELADAIEGTAGSFEWGADDRTIFYTTVDAAHRPHKLWRHVVGSAQAEDECLLTEPDELFYLSLDKSASGRFVFATCESKETSEVHAVDLGASRPSSAELGESAPSGPPPRPAMYLSLIHI